MDVVCMYDCAFKEKYVVCMYVCFPLLIFSLFCYLFIYVFLNNLVFPLLLFVVSLDKHFTSQFFFRSSPNTLLQREFVRAIGCVYVCFFGVIPADTFSNTNQQLICYYLCNYLGLKLNAFLSVLEERFQA